MRASKIDPRQKLIRLIHVAKRELRLDDATYRGILQAAVKKSSSSEMTVPELEKTLEHMKRCGFKVRSKKSSIPLAQDPESKKIRALWIFLHELGLVRNSSEAALAAYVKRITGVEALQWLNGQQAETMIESLKKWAMRRLPATVKEMRVQVNWGVVSLASSDYNGAILCGRQPTDEQRLAFSLHCALVEADRFKGFDKMFSTYELLQEWIRRNP